MQDPQQALEESIIEFDGRFAHVTAYAEQLTPFLKNLDDEAQWYNAVLAALVNALVAEYARLRRGIAEDKGLLAWACRNLVELNVFTQYVLKSDANAKEFFGHRLVYTVHMMEAIRDLQRVLDPDSPNEENAEILAEFYRQKQKEKITTRQYLNVGVMAESISEAKAAEYDAFNRICSKYVHPTAVSILTAHQHHPEEREFHRGLYNWGASAGYDAYRRLKTRIDTLGILNSGA
jgi:hypothetical protein